MSRGASLCVTQRWERRQPDFFCDDWGIEAKVASLTNRRMTSVPLPLLIDDINDAVRGWCAYFHYQHSMKVLSRVKWFTEERVRKHLRVRHKVRTRTEGYRRFSTEFLYNHLGLYKVPTWAKWRKAQAPCDEEHQKAVYGRTVPRFDEGALRKKGFWST